MLAGETRDSFAADAAVIDVTQFGAKKRVPQPVPKINSETRISSVPSISFDFSVCRRQSEERRDSSRTRRDAARVPETDPVHTTPDGVIRDVNSKRVIGGNSECFLGAVIERATPDRRIATPNRAGHNVHPGRFQPAQ